jgi:hypothetical protein
MSLLDLFSSSDSIFRRFPPIVTDLSDEHPRTQLWDIPYTIPELGYLTHDHFRYYGKFPSVLAGKIIDDYLPSDKSHSVLDNFCGSGTTMLEAALRNHTCKGIDSSWIAVLASNVKTRHVSIEKVERQHRALLGEYFSMRSQVESTLPFAMKWFTPEAAQSLAALKIAVDNLAPSPEADFLRVAFLAIIRRVSRAYDAEVRPHINVDKPTREVVPAFSKKVRDMIHSHSAMMELTSPDLESVCYLGDNRSLPVGVSDDQFDLVISHRPI